MNDSDLINAYIEEAFKEIDELIKSKVLLNAKLKMSEKLVENLTATLKSKDEELEKLKKNKKVQTIE